MPERRLYATIVPIYAKERSVNDGLGAGFWFKLIGLVLLFGIGGILLFVFVGAAWARWGGLGALVFFFIIFLAFGYIYDRRHAKAYEDLEA
jgi:hypothetical protein